MTSEGAAEGEGESQGAAGNESSSQSEERQGQAAAADVSGTTPGECLTKDSIASQRR